MDQEDHGIQEDLEIGWCESPGEAPTWDIQQGAALDIQHRRIPVVGLDGTLAALDLGPKAGLDLLLLHHTLVADMLDGMEEQNIDLRGIRDSCFDYPPRMRAFGCSS